jgi:regulator of nucleoside diphosphate kinase
MPEIILTRPNFGRLENVIADYGPIASASAVRLLRAQLSRARVVDANTIPPTNVTMGSQVEVLDRGTGRTGTVTLVYPGEQGLYPDAVSILTPLGAALLGLAKSQSITYADAHGERTIEVLRVLHQPEMHLRFRRTPRVRHRSPLN